MAAQLPRLQVPEAYQYGWHDDAKYLNPLKKGLTEDVVREIIHYLRASDRAAKNWDDVPAYIKQTFDKLGIPQAEQKYLAGVGSQYDSESIYHNIRKDLEKLGVIFMDTDTALKEHGDIVKQYFGTVIPANDNKL